VVFHIMVAAISNLTEDHKLVTKQLNYD